MADQWIVAYRTPTSVDWTEAANCHSAVAAHAFVGDLKKSLATTGNIPAVWLVAPAGVELAIESGLPPPRTALQAPGAGLTATSTDRLCKDSPLTPTKEISMVQIRAESPDRSERKGLPSYRPSRPADLPSGPKPGTGVPGYRPPPPPPPKKG